MWFGDERWVPVHDPDSNEGMARLAFVDEVDRAARRIRVRLPDGLLEA